MSEVIRYGGGGVPYVGPNAEPKEEEFVLNCSIEETWDDGEVSSTSGSFDYKATILPLEGGDFLLAKN